MYIEKKLCTWKKITNNSLIGCGECLYLIRLLPDKSVDLILTDPPYNIGLFMHKRGTNIKGLIDNYAVSEDISPTKKNIVSVWRFRRINV